MDTESRELITRRFGATSKAYYTDEAASSSHNVLQTTGESDKSLLLEAPPG